MSKRRPEEGCEFTADGGGAAEKRATAETPSVKPESSD
jgi:hypothetical protein